MRIQDKFHPDGISYESGDEFSETESELRSSQEKLNGNGTHSSPSKDLTGMKKKIKKIKSFFNIHIYDFLFSNSFIYIKKISNWYCFSSSYYKCKNFVFFFLIDDY